jgi:hypothetical protein
MHRITVFRKVLPEEIDRYKIVDRISKEGHQINIRVPANISLRFKMAMNDLFSRWEYGSLVAMGSGTMIVIEQDVVSHVL